MSHTLKHHATRSLGFFIALGSMPFLLVSGVLASSFSFGFFGILTGVAAAGVVAGLGIAYAGHRGLGKARRRATEKTSIAEIARRQGRITVAELMASTSLDIEQSRDILERLCDMGEGERQVLPSGKFLYVFDDFLPLDEKESARDPFRDPLDDLLID